MNIGNILNRRLGLVTIPNLQRVVNNLLETIGFVNDALPDSRPYKVYTALLSHFSTDAPTVTVLENTIGNVVWSRASAGLYNATLSGAFPENKSFSPNHQARSSNENDVDFNVRSMRYDDNTFSVMTLNPTSGLGIDGVLELYPIEIRVYN